MTRARLCELLHYERKTGQFRWRKRMNRKVLAGDIAGSLAVDRYRKITIRRKKYRAHHLAWLYVTGEWCPVMIDHRDGDPSNNRWSNLRRATVSQNNANRRRQRNNKCGFKGVTRNEAGRWRASIYKKGRKHHLGIFSTPQDAHAAYAA